MTTILRLDGNGNLCWAVVGEDDQITLLPFLSEEQALLATGELVEHWPAIRRVSYRWRAVAGGPRGYLFFARLDADGVIVGVVVSGPYGLLPGEYPSLEAASDAAWDDWWDHNPEPEHAAEPPGYTG